MYRLIETVEGSLGVLRLTGSEKGKQKMDGELGVQRLTGNVNFN